MKIENNILHGPMTEQDLTLLNKQPQKFWNGVTEIGAYSFYNCVTLPAIVIPINIQAMGACALPNNGKLKITIEYENDKYSSVIENDFYNYGSKTLSDPLNSHDLATIRDTVGQKVRDGELKAVPSPSKTFAVTPDATPIEPTVKSPALEGTVVEPEDAPTVEGTPAVEETVSETTVEPSKESTKKADAEIKSNPKFDMDVKFKDGTVTQQNYTFSDEENKIIIGDFTIQKETSGKWSLNFALDNENLKGVADKVAFSHETHFATNNVKIPLAKVKIADNGNIEFELETTKDMRLGKARNFTITPNSIKTSSTEISIAPAGKVVDVTLPKNFPQLFLGKETTSTISSALPVEFFSTIINNKDFFSGIDTHTIQNGSKDKSVDLLKVDGNVYTLVNSKMIKAETAFHINQGDELHKVGFTFKKGAEKIARTLNNVDATQDSNVATFLGISPADWTDENKHLYDDATLSTQGLTAREFATTDKSRAKNASTFEAVETTPEQTQDEPETSGDSNETEETKPTEGTEGTEGIIADSTNQENETGDEASTEENKDENSEENKDEKEITEQADNKKEKEEKYKFSSAPLFYIGGLLLGILGILTGFAWLLVLAFMMFAAPKLTEGIVNDAKKVKVEKTSKRQKMSKQEKALIKQKNKDLRRARTSLKNKSKNFKLSPEWQETTSKLFFDKILTKEAKDALKKIQPNNIQRDKILEHSNKIRETEKYINQIEKDIAKNKYNEETTEKLRNVISEAKQDLENAKKSNNAILEKFDIANGIVDAANSDKLTQNKLAAGMNALGIAPNQIYDTATDTSILDSEEKIADINEMLAQNYSDYGLDISKYLAKDGLLDEKMKEINSIIEPPTKSTEKTEVKEKDGEPTTEPTAETSTPAEPTAETSTPAPTPEATPTPAPEVAKAPALEDPKPVKAPEVTRER